MNFEKLTIEEWQARIQSNLVFRSMKAVREVALLVATGRRQNALIAGPAGVGKTWAFETAFQAHKVTYIQPSGITSPRALIDLLSRSQNGVFLFDDCDSILTNSRFLNLLKRITDTKDTDRMLSWESKQAIESFIFRGQLIVLTNIDLLRLASGPLGAHVRALNDRCDPYYMSFDHYALWEYSVYLAIVKRMLLHKSKANREQTNEALRYFTETLWQRESASPRALVTLAKNIVATPHWREFEEPRLRNDYHKIKGKQPLAPVLPDPSIRVTTRKAKDVSVQCSPSNKSASIGSSPPKSSKLLSDDEWAFLAPFVIKRGPRQGRPPTSHRRMMDAIFWIARSNSPWNGLPISLGRWKCVHQQFRRWTQSGVWEVLLRTLSEHGAMLTDAGVEGMVSASGRHPGLHIEEEIADRMSEVITLISRSNLRSDCLRSRISTIDDM